MRLTFVLSSFWTILSAIITCILSGYESTTVVNIYGIASLILLQSIIYTLYYTRLLTFVDLYKESFEPNIVKFYTYIRRFRAFVLAIIVANLVLSAVLMSVVFTDCASNTYIVMMIIHTTMVGAWTGVLRYLQYLYKKPSLLDEHLTDFTSHA